jgi:hypothetical protein
MGDGVEFVELELEFRSDIDICSFIFGRVAIFGRGEDCVVVSNQGVPGFVGVASRYPPVTHFPPCSTS